MTPLEVCEPLFQYICRVNRSARKGGIYAHDEVREEVKAILSEIGTKVAADPALAAQFAPKRGKLWLVLLFFVDFMIRDSNLSFAGDWNDLARAEKELAGDDRFFEFLQETLGDQSEAATLRLPVYYACLGLGFTGAYRGQPEFLRRKMLEISARLRAQIGTDTASRICPEAYENVNTDNLIKPANPPLIGISIALVGMAIVLFVANAWMYRNSRRDLVKQVDAIARATNVRSSPASSAPVVPPVRP
jgi:hypothetical protein